MSRTATPSLEDIPFKPAFGEMVSFDTILKRNTEWRDGWNHCVLSWMPSVRCCGLQRTGIFLGWRILANGYRYYDSEEGHYFKPKSWIRVALVCPGERLNPVYVDPKNLKKF